MALPSVIPGTYTVRVAAKGFQTTEQGNVLVQVGQNVRVDLVLQPGEQTQTITVTGEIPAIDTTDAQLGGTVSNNLVNSLPLNGRNFDRLIQLTPGVVRLSRRRWHGHGRVYQWPAQWRRPVPGGRNRHNRPDGQFIGRP